MVKLPSIGKVVMRVSKEDWLTQKLVITGNDEYGSPIYEYGVLIWGATGKRWTKHDGWSTIPLTDDK